MSDYTQGIKDGSLYVHKAWKQLEHYRKIGVIYKDIEKVKKVINESFDAVRRIICTDIIPEDEYQLGYLHGACEMNVIYEDIENGKYKGKPRLASKMIKQLLEQ